MGRMGALNPKDKIALALPNDDDKNRITSDTAATDTEETSDPVADNPGKGKKK